MHKAPKQVYLLRKSIQANVDIPVLKRDDFPLRFLFKGQEVTVAITPQGNITIGKQRLAGTDGE